MNFKLSEEQNMLKDSVARFVQDQYTFEARCEIAESEEGFNRKNWQTFAELGWLSIPFSEEYGGFDGGAVDMMSVMEEMGKGLVLEPFVSTVLLFGGLLGKSNNSALKDEYIHQIIEGKLQGALAINERQSRYELNDIKTTATRDGDSYILNGEKTVVGNGHSADKLIISARTDGNQLDEKGITLFLLDAGSDGVEKTDYKMMDGRRVANITLTDVSLPKTSIIGEQGEGFGLLKSVSDETKVALCAEALGIMLKLNEMTVEYTKTRQQFGVAIGSFQVLQHRMVDMFMACEQVKSLLYRTVCSMDDGSADVEKNILALKVMTGRAGKLIGGEAIQIHGGMGITDELSVGHYVKRLMIINASFGDADYHQQKFAELSIA